jgi:aminopeptidase N
MDEGFTSYISSLAMNEVMNQNRENPNAGSYNGYIRLATSGVEQSLTTHADRYQYNRAYGTSAYSKGAVFMAQLGYVIGEDALKKTIKKYYQDFAFKHPTPNDFIRTAEKVSGMQLGWYLIDFGQTTNTIDYAVNNIDGNSITLERIGLMPMPLDVTVTFNDNTTETFHIPLRMARGHKPTSATVIDNWAWAYPTYIFETDKQVKSVEIDPKNLMADVDKSNNKRGI